MTMRCMKRGKVPLVACFALADTRGSRFGALCLYPEQQLLERDPERHRGYRKL